MGQPLVYKIISEHLADGKIAAGEEIGIRIDQNTKFKTKKARIGLPQN